MEVKHFRPKLPSRAVARGPVITQSGHRARVGCVVWRPRLPGMGRRELVAAEAVFPPQAPRLGPVAGRAGAWCQCSAPAQPGSPTHLQTPDPTQRPGAGWRNCNIGTKQSLCLQLETNPLEVCTITEKAEGPNARSRGLLRDFENSVEFVSSSTAAPRDVKWSRNNECQHCWSQCSAVVPAKCLDPAPPHFRCGPGSGQGRGRAAPP